MSEYKLIEEQNASESCLECGTALYGRPDKRFCCESCKNRYHNRRTQNLRNLKLRTRSILDRNYKILSDLLRDRKVSVNFAELSLLGYNREYVTSHHRVNRHDQCSCYDIVFTVTDSKICKLHKLENERTVRGKR